MKALLIIIATIIIIASAQAQTVDTTNSNRVVFVFTVRQQSVLSIAFGHNWKKGLVEQLTERCNMAFSSDASEQIATKAKRDSLTFYRNQILRIKEEIK